MNCQGCHQPIEGKDPIIYGVRETFVFKPADVEDEPAIIDGKDGPREVNAAAILSPDALRESRKDHLRQEIATVFSSANEPLREGAFNVRHSWCAQQVQSTGSIRPHPIYKHAIRFQRRARV